MLTRRRFIKLSAFTGAGLLIPSLPILGCGDKEAEAPANGTAQTLQQILKPASQLDRFIDPLPVPPVLSPDTDTFEGMDYYEINLTQSSQQFHSQLQPAAVWGYEGMTPGPTIEARRGRPVRVRWINGGLPDRHLLAASIDKTIFHGNDWPDVRTVTHLHGGHTPPHFDGQPDAWSTPGAAQTGPRFTSGDFIYPNTQQACMLWYHDHAMAITRLNIYAGLAGLYFIRDEEEDGLGLPGGEYEIPLVIQDRALSEEGALSYPTVGTSPEHPLWVEMFLGDIPLINGRAYPYLSAEPRRYRLRMLNGSQSRTYDLRLETGGGNHAMHVIGTDGGFLPEAVTVQSIRLSPAERADVIVDFSGFAAGTVITLKNDAPAPFPGGGDQPLPELMQIRIDREPAGSDLSTPPEDLELPALSRPALAPDTPSRIFDLDNINPGGGNVTFLINNRFFDDPVEERPRAGAVEVWEFVNLTLDAHPIHVHLVQFQILNRQAADTVSYFTAREDFRAGGGPRPDINNYLTGDPTPPPPESAGWKDTALSMPGEVLRLIVPFDLPPMTATPARYILHCHILEHEDNEMMLPYEVI